MNDPTTTDPDKYKVIFENERVRVLEYRDTPGRQRGRTSTLTASCTRSRLSNGGSLAKMARLATSRSKLAKCAG
jgi:hypothetical protein